MAEMNADKYMNNFEHEPDMTICDGRTERQTDGHTDRQTDARWDMTAPEDNKRMPERLTDKHHRSSTERRRRER